MAWSGNSNSNNNENGSNHNKPSREQRMEEIRILEGFMKLIRHKMETSPTIQEMANNNYSTEADYAAERQVLMQVNNLGLREGLVAGALTFLTLRRGPAMITKYIMRREATRASRYGGSAPQSSSTSSSSSSSTYKLDAPNPFAKANRIQPGGGAKPGLMFLRVLRFGLDVFVSFTVAASTSLYFTDQDYLFAQVANVPLVEGRSLVADEFCEDICKEFEQYPVGVWNNTQHPGLETVRTFVKNCKRRRAYEDKLRKEYGLGPDEPIKIPSPGVDTSFTMAVNPYGSGDDDNGDDGDGDEGANAIGDDPFAAMSQGDYFGEKSNGDNDSWAKSLVSDQEEGGRKGSGY